MVKKQYIGNGQVAFISTAAGKASKARHFDYQVFKMNHLSIAMRLIWAEGDPRRINIYG